MGKKAEAPPPPDPEPAAAPEEPKGEQHEGDFVFPDGAEYRGQYFQKGESICMHGEGRLQSGPEVFQGQFEMGQYRWGKFISCNNAIYKGWFRGNLYHGAGEYSWPDGRKYCGMWSNGQMHGRGTYTNFSFGVDAMHKDLFSVRGRFASSAREQEKAKKEYLAEYAPGYVQSATAALLALTAKATPAEPVDPKKKGKGAAEEEAGISDEALRLVLVPHEDVSPEAAKERAAIENIVSGPYPDASSLQAAALVAFNAAFAEGAEKLGVVTICEGRGLGQCGHLDSSRLHAEQLAHVGQVVDFSCPEAEPGALLAVMFVNAGSEYDVAAARWKLIHVELVPIPEGEEPPHVDEKPTKGKK